MGEEIVKLNPDYVFVPVGNGALIIGVTRGIKKYLPNVKIVGVCAEKAPCMFHSFQHIAAYFSNTSPTSVYFRSLLLTLAYDA